MSNVKYAAVLEAQPEGGFTVTFPDIPEAITEGDTREEALFHAADVLTLCLDERIESGDAVPVASKLKGGIWVEPSAAVQAAFAVRAARQEQGRSLAELARSMGTSWAAAQKLESPCANPTLRQLDRAARALGKRLILTFE
ncbi:MAG: type II toxin-antitoxin system HicB family antitoxin [Rhodoferax sp.]|nr:type II toxin-antitoxin system HicB family antitoxin [Rhodoferax sp.]